MRMAETHAVPEANFFVIVIRIQRRPAAIFPRRWATFRACFATARR